jgi:hypothetical protein
LTVDYVTEKKIQNCTIKYFVDSSSLNLIIFLCSFEEMVLTQFLPGEYLPNGTQKYDYLLIVSGSNCQYFFGGHVVRQSFKKNNLWHGKEKSLELLL